jgi:hypothetical protein
MIDSSTWFTLDVLFVVAVPAFVAATFALKLAGLPRKKPSASPTRTTKRFTLMDEKIALGIMAMSKPTEATKERTEADVIREAHSPEHRLLRAPVQGYQGGIPWPIHLEAYEVYCKRYGPQTAMIDLKGRGCRGGFSDGELDMFIPGWRERVSPIAEMQREIERLTKENAELKGALQHLGYAPAYAIEAYKAWGKRNAE